MKTVALLVLLTFVATQARAEATYAVWSDASGTLERIHFVQPNVPFTVVVTLQSDGSSVHFVEWSMPDIRELYPSIFLLGTTTPGDTNCALGGCLRGPGDFQFPFDACQEPVEQTVVARIQYLDTVGVIASGLIMTAGPLAADAGRPSLLDESPGFRDCDSVDQPATSGGSPELEIGCHGGPLPAGSLWVSPDCGIPAANQTLGTLKARY